MNLNERAKSLGLSCDACIHDRYRHGWTAWEAISLTKEQGRKRGSDKHRKLFHNGRYIGEFIKPENLNVARKRIWSGMHPKEAIELQDIRFRHAKRKSYD